MSAEKLIDNLYFLFWLVPIGLAILIVAGIIQRIYENKKYGYEEDKEDITVQPMAHYGAMPIHIGKPAKLDFGYDEEQERAVEEADNKLKMDK